jgi:alkanesulfonate monooxygenase SsuD/methylene tetrahydromethanopterin reductase-like flavin-dependent oxidoreductase (luciferase family)
MDIGVFDHLDGHDLPLSAYYRDRLSLIEAYEEAGFYAYHLAEHHATPLGMAPSPSVFLAAVAERTRRIRFGPLVWALPLYHPLRLIEEICMLDQLSGGRLELGFGRGSSPVEIEYFGADADMAHTERVYREALAVIRAGLTGKVLDFEGEFYKFQGVPMQMAPLQQPMPPIWYGAHAPDSAERAARAGFHIVSLDPPALARTLFDCYGRTWRAAHGDAPMPKVGLGRFIVVAPTDAEALALGRRAYARWHESFTYLFRLHNREQRHPRPETFDRLLEVGQGIAGTPETVLREVRRQTGGTDCNYLVGQFAFGDLTLEETRRSLDLFVREVAPALRAA